MKQTVVKSILLEIIYKINLLTVINLSMPLVEEKKVKVLMMEVKQNNKKLKKKRRIKKQGLFKKKRYKQERNK